MTKLVLYHKDMSTCAQKVRFVLAEKGMAFEGRHLNLRAGDQHTAEYLKLNPLGVVPTLVVDDRPIVESTVICEFLDDFAPSPPLRPEDPIDRAVMRLWLKKLDSGMHAETGVMSSAIAFRYQKLEHGEAHARELVEKVPDPAKRERMRSIVFEGVESPLFLNAMTSFDQLLHEINDALQTNPWLAGPAFSLADACYAPYMTRLDHLSLSGL